MITNLSENVVSVKETTQKNEKKKKNSRKRRWYQWKGETTLARWGGLYATRCKPEQRLIEDVEILKVENQTIVTTLITKNAVDQTTVFPHTSLFKLNITA